MNDLAVGSPREGMVPKRVRGTRRNDSEKSRRKLTQGKPETDTLLADLVNDYVMGRYSGGC